MSGDSERRVTLCNATRIGRVLAKLALGVGDDHGGSGVHTRRANSKEARACVRCAHCASEFKGTKGGEWVGKSTVAVAVVVACTI